MMVTNGGDNPSLTVKTLLKWHVKITGENEYSPQYQMKNVSHPDICLLRAETTSY